MMVHFVFLCAFQSPTLNVFKTTTMGKSTKSWACAARRTVLEEHEAAYKDAPEGKKRKDVLDSIKEGIRAAQGPPLPKKLTDVRRLPNMTQW
jgi:hypothetical protein